MTHYSVQPRNRKFVKGYGFLSFAKNMSRNVRSKYSQKLLDNAKQSTTEALKTSSKRVIQNTVEATGDLIGNRITDKITRSSKPSPQDSLETNEEILKKNIQTRN